MKPSQPLIYVISFLLFAAATSQAQVRSQIQGNALPPADPAQASAITQLAHPPTPTLSPQRHDAFARAVDTSAFAKLAVFDRGRVKIVDTLAREQLDRISGKSHYTDPDIGRSNAPTFTYLDLLFNQNYYLDKPIIQVDVLPLRQHLLEHLPAPERQVWLKRGRLSPNLLNSPLAQAAFQGLNADLRLFKAKQSVMFAAQTLSKIGSHLNLISPPVGSEKWGHLSELADPTVLAQLGDAWRSADADRVNQRLAQLVDMLPRIHPQTYPGAFRLEVEWLYNGLLRYILSWVGYLIATVSLLIAFSTGRRWLVTLGASALCFAFTINTLSFAARMLLSGRWPIHNQYESFIAMSWFAVGVGIVLMLVKKQWLYGAAASVLGFCAMVFASTVAIPSSDVSQVAGILGTSRILYVHVNMVLVSYALIGLSFFVSLFYLGVYYLKNASAVQIAAAGVGAVDAQGLATRGREALLRDLDKSQIIVMQLAFWLLGFGILLGAYWADHAWGRWWGWDPKETWALVTWIVYLIAIHARFGVKNRGLVTAWLSVIGFVVMLWTYWGVNLYLAGLHSYA